MRTLSCRRRTSGCAVSSALKTKHGSSEWTWLQESPKKNDHAKNCVETAQTYKTDHSISFKDSSKELDTAYSTLMRYKTRIINGEDPVRIPGPKLIRPPDPEEVNSQIRDLEHSRKRTKGTGELIDAYRGMFAEKELYQLIKQARKDANHRIISEHEHLQWLIPGSVWSMDDTEHALYDRKNQINHVADLATCYKVGAKALSKHHDQHSVAEHLNRLFTEHPAPLILKRDNGGNLCSKAVDEVLDRHMVIPLTSPTYYPKYNGSIEAHQNSLKRNIEREFQDKGIVKPYSVLVELAMHKCNHRRSSKGSKTTACQRFHANPFNMNKRERKEVFQWIEYTTLDIGIKIGHLNKSEIKDLRRWVIETWLEENGFLNVFNRTKCKPFFGRDVYHN